MDNFRKSGPGGLRNRPEFVGGRPKSDADYGTKKKFGNKPAFGGGRGGDKGNHKGRGGHGDRGGRGSFGGGRGGERRDVEMFKTTCSACGKTAEVPFRPDGSKPVLCRDCFGGKSDDRGGFGKHDRFSTDRGERKPERKFDRPDRESSPDYQTLLKKVEALEGKVSEVLSLLKKEASATAATAAPEEKAKFDGAEVAAVTKVKEKKPKKVAAKKVVKKVAKKVVKKVAKK